MDRLPRIQTYRRPFLVLVLLSFGLPSAAECANPELVISSRTQPSVDLTIIAPPNYPQYNVQRSFDMQRWTTIGTVAATANPALFHDVTADGETAFYRSVGVSTPAVPNVPPAQEIWIARRTDGLAGSGTQADPFDGSTAAKFDAILNTYSPVNNMGIHLVGSGPFLTDVAHSWNVRSGWIISGDGLFETTVQLVGNLAGRQGAGVFGSDPNGATNNVTIRDLTIDCNWPALAATADDAIGGEKAIGVSAVLICGSNNLLERVRCMNTYGSWQNRKEHFAMFLTAPRNAEGINNVIRECRAELPRGSYGNPFALAGWTFTLPNYAITSSSVIACTAIGRRDGLDDGFNSGGVNLATIKNCLIAGNTFVDCLGAAYIDVGTIDGLVVQNNVVVRGWMGAGLRCPGTKQNITVSGNYFGIQNRYANGASYGLFIDSGLTSNLMVSQNTLIFDTSGAGIAEYYGIAAWLLNGATISDNTFGFVNATWYNVLSGVSIQTLNNRMIDGSPVPGMAN